MVTSYDIYITKTSASLINVIGNDLEGKVLFII